VDTEWAQPTLGGRTNVYAQATWQNRADAEGFLVSETAAARSFFNPLQHYLLPIPARQININPKLKQNPNW
jgi:hypothetical protein